MRTFLWPIILIVSTYIAGLVTFVFPTAGWRPVVMMWFLFVCPGMVIMRFFRFRSPAIEWSIALGLSFAIDGIVSSILLYSGRWSPLATLVILMMFCSVGISLYLLALLMTFFKSTGGQLVPASVPSSEPGNYPPQD